MRSVDAIVIGAGVIGAAIALELERAGRHVIVVDKGDAVGGGSTSGSAAVVRFTYSTLEGVVASREALHRWVKWSEHLGHVDGPVAAIHQVGMLTIDPPETDRTAMIENFKLVGVPYEELDAAEFAERFPMIHNGRYWPPRMPNDPQFFDEASESLGALFMPDSGFVDDPQLAAVNLMDAAKHHGSEVRLRSRVVAVTQSEGRVSGVELDAGEQLHAPVVVNAAGPWSSQLNKIAGVTDDMHLTTRALQRDIVSTTAPDNYRTDTGGVVMMDMDLGTFSRPQPGGSFLAGSVESDGDPLMWVDDPDQTGPNPDPEMWEAVMFRIARRIPELEVPLRPMGLADHYDVTEDWTPIYDRSSLDGFYVAIGTSGNQFKNAPLVGEIMRDLIEAVEGGHDHDAEPLQFECAHVGRSINLGHYSRLRELQNTSGTVMG